MKKFMQKKIRKPLNLVTSLLFFSLLLISCSENEIIDTSSENTLLESNSHVCSQELSIKGKSLSSSERSSAIHWFGYPTKIIQSPTGPKRVFDFNEVSNITGDYLPKISRLREIKVAIHNDMPQELKIAINQALTEYNKIIPIILKFEVVNNSVSLQSDFNPNYDLLFTYLDDELYTRSVAGAKFPEEDGTVGKIININPYKYSRDKANNVWNNDSRKLLIAHEVGHILGFKHDAQTNIPYMQSDVNRYYAESNWSNFTQTEKDGLRLKFKMLYLFRSDLYSLLEEHNLTNDINTLSFANPSDDALIKAIYISYWYFTPLQIQRTDFYYDLYIKGDNIIYNYFNGL